MVKVTRSFSVLLILVTIVTGGGNAYSLNTSPREIEEVYDNPENFHFVVVGDREGSERNGVFPIIMKQLNLLKPAFVVSVGDSIKGGLSDSAKINKEWDEFDRDIQSLTVPFLKAPGNHDIGNKVMADVYRQRYGNPYYFTKYKNVLFLFLNTCDPDDSIPADIKKELSKDYSKLKRMIKTQGYTSETVEFQNQYERRNRDLCGTKISDEQVNYFAKVLEENKDVRWTFVIMHERAWKETSPPENWIKLEKILADRSYTVFGGHEHFYEYTVRNGHDYIGLATIGGGWKWPPEKPGVYDHLLFITMDGDKPIITNILADGIMDKTDIRVHRTHIESVNKQ